ncbi:hypothetical protein ES703_72635 [subsurface metagenome]
MPAVGQVAPLNKHIAPTPCLRFRATHRPKATILNLAVYHLKVIHIPDIQAELVYVVDVEVLQDDMAGRLPPQNVYAIPEVESITTGLIVVGDLQVFHLHETDASEGDGHGKVVSPCQDGTVTLLPLDGDPGVSSARGRRNDVVIVLAQGVAPSQNNQRIPRLQLS